MKPSELAKELKHSELFRGLGEADIEKIASLCEVNTYAAGDEVFGQGDVGHNLYIIEEGLVFLERAMDLAHRKGNVVIGILGKGRTFGCWSVLLGESHNFMATASCQRDTKLVEIKAAALRELMLEKTELGFSVLEELCGVLRSRIRGAYGAMEKL